MQDGQTHGARLRAADVEIGYHPDGYCIDKTASPMDRYTQWHISPEGRWTAPKPVCFHALPQTGWIAADGFDWERGRRIGLRPDDDAL
ncbi:MAG: hypothetical protein JXR37_29315 [Kiritimatiellae bacterium]|nr:hypothetical protein [Kiritimatiellia bacterium]